jgi:hypothetical protein
MGHHRSLFSPRRAGRVHRAEAGEARFAVRAGAPVDVRMRPALLRVAFDRPVAAPGGRAALAIDTAFVGAGAPFEAILSGAGGRWQGRVRGRLSGPQHREAVRIPSRAAGPLVPTVAVPDLSLERRGAPLVLTDPVAVRNVCLAVRGRPAGRVRDGDVLSITAQVGAADGWPAEARLLHVVEPWGATEPVTCRQGRVRRGGVELEWIMESGLDRAGLAPPAGDPTAYRPPTYVAEVRCLGVAGRSTDPGGSGTAELVDAVEGRVAAGAPARPCAGLRYELTEANGRKTAGRLDGDGRFAEPAVVPGPCRLRLEGPEAPIAEGALPTSSDHALASGGREAQGGTDTDAVVMAAVRSDAASVRLVSGRRHRVHLAGPGLSDG